MTVTTHLRNQLNSAVQHALDAHTGPLHVSNSITDAVVRTLDAHASCPHCPPPREAGWERARRLTLARFTPPPRRGLPADVTSQLNRHVNRLVKAHDAAFVLTVLPVLAAHPNLLHYLAGRPVWGAYAGAHGRRSLARRGLA